MHLQIILPCLKKKRWFSSFTLGEGRVRIWNQVITTSFRILPKSFTTPLYSSTPYPLCDMTTAVHNLFVYHISRIK